MWSFLLIVPYSRNGLRRVVCGVPLTLDINVRTGPLSYITLKGPQSRFGHKLLEIWLVCSQNEAAAVLNGSSLYRSSNLYPHWPTRLAAFPEYVWFPSINSSLSEVLASFVFCFFFFFLVFSFQIFSFFVSLFLSSFCSYFSGLACVVFSYPVWADISIAWHLNLRFSFIFGLPLSQSETTLSISLG